MAEFTKEQLIEHAQAESAALKAMIEHGVHSDDVVDFLKRKMHLDEIALAALTAEPFMYGIVAPEGEAYFDECCVSGGKSDLSEIVSNLNDQCESPGEEYREVPLYRLPLLEGLK
ncbi:hypothetical protein GNG26_09955 [Leclercia sp. J807]|uniref:hypothetical protein n=1 Tax=Leclercia sp. J807 TaxID=2681307 RepID=UPI0012E26689|nr:hypothetical protein [Leclercia sp. J807]QGU10657.1 hypothetical protein GNG26_09955 [Leclercia sp. J807]